MQLRTARLCLDCDEVHDAQQCPACASETFAFITRWVPVPERQAKKVRPLEAQSPEALSSYREILDPSPRPRGVWRTVGRGALGLAAFGIAGWLFKVNSQSPSQTESPEKHDRRQK